MGTKRTISSLSSLDLSPQPVRKRTKHSLSNSSVSTSTHPSETSALIPTSDDNEELPHSSITSPHSFTSSGLSTSASSDDDMDSDSANIDSHSSEDDNEPNSPSFSSSSSSSSSKKSLVSNHPDGAGIVNLRVGKKPRIKAMEGRNSGALSLRERLAEFLPKMAVANEVVEEQKRKGAWKGRGLEDVDEDREEGYIEMVSRKRGVGLKGDMLMNDGQSLGLGVLEQKKGGTSRSSSDESSGDYASDADDERPPGRDIMAKLMGRKGQQQHKAGGIEEMDTQ
ncbi:MAG: hypothetical protein M1820_001982 [Bogoriella megaspora]|nr:MAG: hypothetical protein M1820_001982 [Bogoriella megaspora]